MQLQPSNPMTKPMLPPELPTRHPLGHFGAFREDMLQLFLDIQHKCGDIARMRIGPVWVYVISHPRDVERVLVSGQKYYSKQTKGYDALRLLLGQGLVTSEGSFWKRQRRIAQPAFHKQRLLALTEMMRKASKKLQEDLLPVCDTGKEIDIAASMMKITLQIAGETLFGVDLSDDSNQIGGSVTDMMQYHRALILRLIPYPQWVPTESNRRGQRSIETLDRVVYQIISERRISGNHGMDLLGMLMDARDEETGESMTDQQLRDEVITMLIAGHETTANILTWSLYLLSKHPDIARKAQEEIDSVLTSDEPPTGMQLSSFSYLEQIISESMRLYPPVWALARRAEKDDVLGGYRIPKGAYVATSPYVVHRHREFWENPEGFDPERFSPEKLQDKSRPKLAYFPFSAGPRKCIGDHFAKMEALIVLASLLKRYQFSLVSHHRVKMDVSITLRPENGMYMTLQKRA